MFYLLVNAVFAFCIYDGFYAPDPSNTSAISALIMAWVTAVPVILSGFFNFASLVDIYKKAGTETGRTFDIIFDIGVTIALFGGGAIITALIYAAHIIIVSNARYNALYKPQVGE